MEVNTLKSFIFDYNRTNTFEEYIKANVSGKTVVDCGGGSGILTHLCIENGATKVYCLENDTTTYDNLTSTFDGNSKVDVQNLDCFTQTLPTGDIYLHEFFGASLWDEDILDFISNLNSQSITTIFPENIIIYSCDTIRRSMIDTQYLTFDNSNLSSDVLAFAGNWNSNYKWVFNYRWIEIGNKQVVYSGKILDLDNTHSSHVLWEINTEHGIFNNMRTDWNCWNLPKK